MILEPKLLQLAYDVLNKQYEYDNNLYLDEFLIRAQKVVNQLQESCSRTQLLKKCGLICALCRIRSLVSLELFATYEAFVRGLCRQFCIVKGPFA